MRAVLSTVLNLEVSLNAGCLLTSLAAALLSYFSSFFSSLP
jgi:hypothetical protein